ncbi:MAG: SelT/SelW/SelH family protein [Chloroflexi bacterium]|nr:SelT/SelW/SelH family protein [Chloroflexota bacterium]
MLTWRTALHYHRRGPGLPVSPVLSRCGRLARDRRPATVSYRASPGTRSTAVAKDLLRVEIRYCAECGYGHEALAVAKLLMERFDAYLAEIRIVPWHDGAFDVIIDGAVAHSMYRDGGFPSPGKVVEAVREHLGPSA